MGDFSHLSQDGRGQMVDVTEKDISQRSAAYSVKVQVGQACADQLNENSIEEISRTARLAGIMAAKKTAHLIPFCHQLNLSKVEPFIEYDSGVFLVSCYVKTNGSTGVEMEALIGAHIAAATIYDMVKAVAPEAEITDGRLLKKFGGKSREWQRA